MYSHIQFTVYELFIKYDSKNISEFTSGSRLNQLSVYINCTFANENNGDVRKSESTLSFQ